jgi:hypothetical protein
MNNTYVSLLSAGQYVATNQGTALANSTSATDISPGGNTAGQALTLPAGYLQPGVRLRILAKGIVSTTGTPNLTLGVYLGGVAGSALATTGAVATGSGLANQVWSSECDIRVVSPSSVYALGNVSNIYASTAMMPATSSSGNLVTGLAATSQILTLGATWGTASASNTIQVILFDVQRFNEGSS